MKWKLLSIPLGTRPVPSHMILRNTKTSQLILKSLKIILVNSCEVWAKVRRCRHSHKFSKVFRQAARETDRKFHFSLLIIGATKKKKLKLNFVSTRKKTTLKFLRWWYFTFVYTHDHIFFDFFFQHSPLAPHIDVHSIGNTRRRWKEFPTLAIEFVTLTDQKIFFSSFLVASSKKAKETRRTKKQELCEL